MCQSSLISCNKCTTGRNVDNGGGYACVGVGVFGNPSSEFSCLKLFLKINSIKKKKWNFQCRGLMKLWHTGEETIIKNNMDEDILKLKMNYKAKMEGGTADTNRIHIYLRICFVKKRQTFLNDGSVGNFPFILICIFTCI